MAPGGKSFRESNLYSSPIRDLGLSIKGTRLESLMAEFEAELRTAGLAKVPLRVYLSTEWGVPFGTVVIGIPFYLARPELTDLHAQQVGHIEGFDGPDILRYLRHEMGHVVNYAYRLYNREDWVHAFGSITQPYLENYRPQPFSRRYVRHLPGWYGQKHPDEDWAETFAVWLTPGRSWREQYAHWPTALAKLELCDRILAELKDVDPPVTAVQPDEDVSELTISLADYYREMPEDGEPSPGLDGDLRAIFDDVVADPAGSNRAETRPAADLLRRLERQLMAEVFRWTGHFPEKTRTLVRHLAERATALQQVYALRDETEVIIAVTIFVTSLAMNHVHRGTYFPETQVPAAPDPPAGA